MRITFGDICGTKRNGDIYDASVGYVPQRYLGCSSNTSVPAIAIGWASWTCSRPVPHEYDDHTHIYPVCVMSMSESLRILPLGAFQS